MSSKLPGKAELIQRFNTLKVELQAPLVEYSNLHNLAHELKWGYTRIILRAFATAAVKNSAVKDSDREIIKEFYDLDAMERLPSYNWISAFVVLRYYIRKLKILSNSLRFHRSFFADFIGRVKELDRLMTAKNMSEQYPAMYADLLKLRDILLSYKQQKFMDLASFYSSIEMPFLAGWKMEKHSFLQIISVDKGKHSEPVTPFSKLINEIPEEIDFEAFKDLIFLDKIERDGDCYLFEIFMYHSLDVMEQYKKKTGISGIDIFQEIAGKPLQTFTAHNDEYGDVVSMEPNKPNLKLVDSSQKE